MEARRAPDGADIRAYLRVLDRRKLTIAITTLILVALALAYSFVKTPLYTASAQLLVPEKAATSALAPAASQGFLPATESVQRMLLDAQLFAEGDQTAIAAAAILGHRAPISISASSVADALTFTATSPSKTEAGAIANAYPRAYITASRNNDVAQYTQQVNALQASIAQLQNSASSPGVRSQTRIAAQSSISSLTQSLQQLQAASQLAMETGPSIVKAARIPKSPSTPNPLRNGLLGLVAGLVLGLGLALLRDRLDDKVKSLADAEESSSGRPVVGTIPVVDRWRNASETHLALREDPNSAVSEAYRTLRTAVQFLGIEEPRHVIGITSSTPGEGKSTTVANLAVSFARAGQRVVVMSCDFRRPRMHQFFDLDNRVGLTSILLGECTLRDGASAVAGEPNLRVIPSGPVPPNPAEILSLDRLRVLVDVVAKGVNIVLLDCPPVLPVTDALIISSLCDSVLVVTAAVVTKKSSLRRTYELLGQVQAPLRGTIVNRVPHRGAYAPDYGYRYGYSYSAEAALVTAGADPASANGGAPPPRKDSRHALAGRITADDATAHPYGMYEEPGVPSDLFDDTAAADPGRKPAAGPNGQ